MRKRVCSILILVSLYAFFILYLTKLFLADVYFTRGKSNLSLGNYEASLNNLNEAVLLNSYEPAYLRYRARAYIGLNQLPLALSDLHIAQELNPKNLATLRNTIPSYYLIATGDSAIMHSFSSQLKNTYPNDLGMLVDIAKYEKALGLVEDYEKTVKQITILRPDVLYWHENFR